MTDFRKHIIRQTTTVKNALKKFNDLSSDAILFVVDLERHLLGSLTDGDMRRGFLKGLNFEDSILEFIQPDPKYFRLGEFSLNKIKSWRDANFKLIPIVDHQNKVIDVINFRTERSFLPLDAVIMAGGKGSRLKPLTDTTPKPLLPIAGKPIVQYNLERLKLYGVKNVTISIKYLGEQIVNYFKAGEELGLNINYVTEDQPLGTIGAVSKVSKINNEYLLVMNSDLLTNIDYEEMFKHLIDNEGDMVVACTPYEVKVPYGVLETQNNEIKNLKEKPTYTYYSNAGIYIFKSALVKHIPSKKKFNATDLMELLISKKKKVLHFPILGYWLDIGKPRDYQKAQNDIEHLTF